jgi:poly(hydroxyalkanoate) depolymerase family esterase
MRLIPVFLFLGLFQFSISLNAEEVKPRFGSKSLPFSLFLPSQPVKGLLVMLHGCLQDAASSAYTTAFNRYADENGWAVLYPQVKKNSHPLNCWAWYEEQNQNGLGQALELMDLIRTVRAEIKLPPSKIALAGLSSGSGLAGILASCFPSEFSALLLHSGPAFASASNAQQAMKVLKEGLAGPIDHQGKACQPQKFSGFVMLVFGNKDEVVHGSHFQQSQLDFLEARKTSERSVRSLVRGKYLKETSFFKGSTKIGLVWSIENLKHAWSGSPVNADFADPQGPIAAQEFFNRIKN